MAAARAASVGAANRRVGAGARRVQTHRAFERLTNVACAYRSTMGVADMAQFKSVRPAAIRDSRQRASKVGNDGGSRRSADALVPDETVVDVDHQAPCVERVTERGIERRIGWSVDGLEDA